MSSYALSDGVRHDLLYKPCSPLGKSTEPCNGYTFIKTAKTVEVS